MADDSCGGQTPFKRLLNQQSGESSGQQDRLVGRPGSQANGSFRSAPQGAQGQDGFSQFMGGPANLPGVSAISPQPHLQAAGRLAAHATAMQPVHPPAYAPQAPAAVVNNWAADFNRMSQQQRQSGTPMANANYQMPMGMANPQLPYQAGVAQPNWGFSPLYGPTNGGFVNANAAAAQRPYAESDFNREMARWMATHGPRAAGGMEDVDAIMEEMAREIERNEAQEAQEAEQAAQREIQNDVQHEAQPPDMQSLSVEDTQTLSAEDTQTTAPKAKSEVSEAAERLLESVQHEGGDKWKNSNFLALMRDFRDGRKDIVENEIRETDDTGSDAESPPDKGKGKAPQ
ncbi:hypothetical protein EDB81DRAFT_642278 [Dactylonectria macrodidyma]|uniref:Peroxin 20 n=1 Tax=Dactylonectria macrodidyma TaxID=307937 RepID=A0A9P9JHB0_9HYPO|nr:hypothetical protein EDB81DRAFT_642278 [Dactylonectria macrodidyma]